MSTMSPPRMAIIRESAARPSGEAVADLHCVRQRAGHEGPASQGHPRDDVQHTEPGVGATVAGDVQPGERSGRERVNPLPKRTRRAGEGEDRAVVVGIGVQIQQARPGCGRQLAQHAGGLTLAHVDHALQHRFKVNRTGRCSEERTTH